jgi:hypothetical protein
LTDTAAIVRDVLAGRPSAVVDAVGAMIQARAADAIAARFSPSDEAEEEETETDGAEGAEGEVEGDDDEEA